MFKEISEECVKGHEMVFCTVGRGIPRGPAIIYPVAARNITQAMNHQGVRRLMFLSIWGVLGENASNLRAAIQLSGLKLFFPDSFREHRRALDELRKYD